MITALFIIAFIMIGLAIRIELVDKRRLERMAQDFKAKGQQS